MTGQQYTEGELHVLESGQEPFSRAIECPDDVLDGRETARDTAVAVAAARPAAVVIAALRKGTDDDQVWMLTVQPGGEMTEFTGSDARINDSLEATTGLMADGIDTDMAAEMLRGWRSDPGFTVTSTSTPETRASYKNVAPNDVWIDPVSAAAWLGDPAEAAEWVRWARLVLNHGVATGQWPHGMPELIAPSGPERGPHGERYRLIGFGNQRAHRPWRELEHPLTAHQVLDLHADLQRAMASPSVQLRKYLDRVAESEAEIWHGKVRPTGPPVASGDGSLGFTIHSWNTWSGSGAWGSATEHVRVCWGSCHRFANVRTTLHFYRVRSHNGHAYFTRLHSDPRHKVPVTSTLKFYSRGVVAW